MSNKDWNYISGPGNNVVLARKDMNTKEKRPHQYDDGPKRNQVFLVEVFYFFSYSYKVRIIKMSIAQATQESC